MSTIKCFNIYIYCHKIHTIDQYLFKEKLYIILFFKNANEKKQFVLAMKNEGWPIKYYIIFKDHPLTIINVSAINIFVY